MYRTAKSLELVEVEVYGCFILCPYLFLHKTLILRNVALTENKGLFVSLPQNRCYIYVCIAFSNKF